MNFKIEEFSVNDVEKKVEWINNPIINKYLHYDLPLEMDKTRKWFFKNINNKSRLDYVIKIDDISVGLIGLLNIDEKNKKAELYITIGEPTYHGLGIANKAIKYILEKSFNELCLNKIYLYTETENIKARKLFEKIGFELEGILKFDLIYNGKVIDRCVYSIIEKGFK